MRFKITSDCEARVTLSTREADYMRTRRVPMLYGAGMGPEQVVTRTGKATVKFGGAVFVDARVKLRAALAAFAQASAAEIKHQDILARV